MNKEFILALKQLEKEKGIDAYIIMEAIEAALISAYKKNYGSLMNVTVHMDQETGDIEVLATKEVVEDVHSPQTEISIDEAKGIKFNVEIGDKSLYDMLKNKKIIERLGVYYQNDDKSVPDVNKTQKRIITYSVK